MSRIPFSRWDRHRIRTAEGKSRRSRVPKAVVAGVAVTAGVLVTAQLADAGTLSGRHHQHHQHHKHHKHHKHHQHHQPSNQSTGSNSDTSKAKSSTTTGSSTTTKTSTTTGSSTTTKTSTTTGSSTCLSAGSLQSSSPWASYAAGGYTIYNDGWGKGYGSQKLWVDSPVNWGVSSTQPPTPGVKSYGNISKSVGIPLNSLSSVTSSFSECVPSVGNWESAYDVWLNGSAYEIMIWTYKNGDAGAIGSPVGTVNLDGNTWTLYVGNNTHNPVYSFVLSHNETSGTVNILNLLKYLENTGGYFSNPTLSTIQYGFEITSTENTQQEFAINNYSASVS